MDCPITSASSGNWTARWEDGKTAPVSLSAGHFRLFNNKYQLLNTNPISFKWQDGSGTVQSFAGWDGRSITWETNNPKFRRIFWDSNSGGGGRGGGGPLPPPRSPYLSEQTCADCKPI